jgi:hypothetical protein
MVNIHELERRKPRGVDGIDQRDQEPTHSARARLDKHRWLWHRHLAAATPTWMQSSATEHSMLARDDGTVKTDSGVNSERSQRLMHQVKAPVPHTIPTV